MTTEQKFEIPNGAAIGAYLSAMIGLLTLGVVVILCEASKDFSERIHSVGKTWIPGAEAIGPYSGKETVALIAWLLSWLVLHFIFRKRELNGGFWLILFLIGMGVATALVWPPVWKLFLAH